MVQATALHPTFPVPLPLGLLRPNPYKFPQPAGPLKKRTSLAASLMIVLFQIISILAAYRSDTLADYSDLKSRALRASIEAPALVAERGGGWEQENMRHNRESWGKVPEDHIPHGAR